MSLLALYPCKSDHPPVMFPQGNLSTHMMAAYSRSFTALHMRGFFVSIVLANPL